ncbi:unnamed protein product [Albugo candida]|uniref:Uncharacterized protein n=1 Tax=Albugo candida TaxID=65357 RepID=A0A024G1Z3_9STRA|nr:unnamed protein product [Albugo candida]|eukprot:CCI40571.1 unnamed protein product [Albugo candida]
MSQHFSDIGGLSTANVSNCFRYTIKRRTIISYVTQTIRMHQCCFSIRKCKSWERPQAFGGSSKWLFEEQRCRTLVLSCNLIRIRALLMKGINHTVDFCFGVWPLIISHC